MIVSLQEEVNRKAIDALENIINQFENKEINNREAYLMTTTLWIALSGLATNNFFELIREANVLFVDEGVIRL